MGDLILLAEREQSEAQRGRLSSTSLHMDLFIIKKKSNYWLGSSFMLYSALLYAMHMRV